MKTPVDLPKKAEEKKSVGLRMIRLLGIIVAVVSSLIIAIHILPSFCLFSCIWLPITVYLDKSDAKWHDADWVGILYFILCATGLIFVPLIIVYVVLLGVLDIDEWNDEIQSWMIAYISWGIISFIITISLTGMVLADRDEIKKFMEMIFFIIGVDFVDIDVKTLYYSDVKFAVCVVLVFPSLAALLPSAIVGFIANYVLEEKFELKCSDSIVNDELCFNNDGYGCCEIISSHDARNTYSFMGGLASNILATWAIIRIIGYLMVNISPEAALFAKRNK